MAPTKDLVALATREALAEKATGKRKKPAQVAKERDLRRLRKGQATPKVAPPPPVERIGEGFPDLPAMMTPPFLLRSVGKGSSRRPLGRGSGVPVP